MNFRAQKLNPQSSNPRRVESSTEPRYQGLPRRIWRGKIVEALRHLNGRGSITLTQLVRKIKDKAITRNDYLYFVDIIERLKRDGIVRHNKKLISLAHG